MSRWTDLATWRGPTKNCGNGTGKLDEPADFLQKHNGIVVHIAQGYYEGTISWQLNTASRVSSHFVIAKDGRIAQVVDTDIRAWTQRAGNSSWLSTENEGFVPDKLTDEQLTANAKLFARGHKEYGYPLQVSNHPNTKGLGHHSMGAENGYDWGHSACPGKAIIAQKTEIVARAKDIVTPPKLPTKPTTKEVLRMFMVKTKTDATVWLTNGLHRRHIMPDAFYVLRDVLKVPLVEVNSVATLNDIAGTVVSNIDAYQMLHAINERVASMVLGKAETVTNWARTNPTAIEPNVLANIADQILDRIVTNPDIEHLAELLTQVLPSDDIQTLINILTSKDA